MLVWPLLVVGGLAAGAGLAGVLAWWPSPLRCAACASLILAGAVVDLAAASAKHLTTDGEVAALVLLVLVGAETGAVLSATGARGANHPRGTGER